LGISDSNLQKRCCIIQQEIVSKVLTEELSIDYCKRYDLVELNDDDLELCKLWLEGKSPYIKKLSNSTLRQKISDKDDLGTNMELGRILTARMAEKIAIKYFKEKNSHCVDVSIEQFTDPDTDEWKKYDIRAGDLCVDVKNSRRSFQSKETYSEHYIKKFKMDGLNQDIEILGTLSPYRRPLNLLDLEKPFPGKEEYEYIEILGFINKNQIDKIQKEFNQPNFFEVDLSGLHKYLDKQSKNNIEYVIPPWCFDTRIIYEHKVDILKLLQGNDINPEIFSNLEGINSFALCLVLGKDPESCHLRVNKWQRVFVEKIKSWKDKGVPFLPC